MNIYTTTDYLNAIRREIAKRGTTYPKIIEKKAKTGMLENELQTLRDAQSVQLARLQSVLSIMENGDAYIDAQSANTYLAELERELKMRKAYYPRLIYFKRITPETAEYETAVWAALVHYFKKQYAECLPY